MTTPPKTRLVPCAGGALAFIPLPLLAAASLSVGQCVTIREEGGRVLITSDEASSDALEEPVNAITPENCHS